MNKKNLILGGILIVLVAIAYLYDGPYQDWQANRGKTENFLSSLAFDQVSAISIAKGGEGVELVKEGDKWKIGGTKSFYVSESDIAAIKTAIDGLAKAELEVVSESQERKADFEATASSGAAVILKQGDTVLREFFLGKPGNDYNSNYLAVADRDETYLAKANLNALNRTDWYDRTIFKADKELIKKIRFQYGKSEFTVEKGENGWAGTAPRQFTVSETKITPILDTLAALQAVEIPAQSFAGTGFEKNSIIIQFMGDGIDQTLMVGDAQDPKAESPRYYAKRGDSDNIYLINEADHDKLVTSMMQLK